MERSGWETCLESVNKVGRTEGREQEREKGADFDER